MVELNYQSNVRRKCLIGCTWLWLVLAAIVMFAVFLPMRISNNSLVITNCTWSVGYRERLCNLYGITSMCYDVYTSLAAVQQCSEIRIFMVTKQKFIAQQYVERNQPHQIHCYYDETDPCYPQETKNDDFIPLIMGLVFIGLFCISLIAILFAETFCNHSDQNILPLE